MSDTNKQRKDIFWKEIIEVMIMPLMYFFFPRQADMIDFSKGARFLDKEFSELFPEMSKDAKGRRADKLVELALKGGGTVWILVHIEVQGYVDTDFARRMFEYYYRILEKYGKRVTALAIFTDDSPSFHPSEYRTELWGTELIYRYNTYKLLDKNPKDFADTNNPFAIIMETAWYALKRNKLNDKDLETLKLRLIRRFLELDYSKEYIYKILRFLSFYIKFDKKEAEIKFIQKLTPMIESNDMTVAQLVAEEYKDILEEVIQIDIQEMKKDMKAEVKEEVKAEVKKEVETATRQDTILKLQKNGFTNEQISNFLEISIEDVLRLSER